MIVTVNGTDVELADGTTISAYLEQRELPSDVVVVELNGDIVPGGSFDRTLFAQGDCVEILRFVGGG